MLARVSCFVFLNKLLPTPHRGRVYKLISNIEDAKNRSHVPATSSEALSVTDNVAGTWRRFFAAPMSVAWAGEQCGWGGDVGWGVCMFLQ